MHPNSVTRWTGPPIWNGLGLLAVECYRPSSDLVNYADKIKTDFDDPFSLCQRGAQTDQAAYRLGAWNEPSAQICQARAQVPLSQVPPCLEGSCLSKSFLCQAGSFLEQELNPCLDKVHEEWRMCFLSMRHTPAKELSQLPCMEREAHLSKDVRLASE